MEEIKAQLEKLWYEVSQLKGKLFKYKFSGSQGLTDNITLKSGFLRSGNYSSSTGWKLTPTSAEINVPTALKSLDIPDTTTANSFHVNTAGDAWWGATTFGAALASISKAGAAIFSNVTASNIITFQTTVATSGGDYTTIGAAISAGKKRIFIRAGTYTENVAISSDNDYILIGENKESVIINGTVTIGPATNDTYVTGTVSTTAGSNVVTGSGTAWLANVVTGNSISIPRSNPNAMAKYKIKSVDSDTQLTLENPLPATMVAGTNYVVYKHMANFTLSNLTVKDSSGSNVVTFKYTRDIIVTDCIIYNGDITATSNLAPLAITSGCVNVQISNVACSGKTNLTNYAIAVYHGGSQTQTYSERLNENVSISNCTGFARAGFLIDWVRGCHITNSYFEQAGSQSTIQQTAGAGGMTTGVAVSNCTFHFGGLIVSPTNFGVEIVGNTFNSIAVTDLTSIVAQNIDLSRCNFSSNTVYGVAEVIVNGRDVVCIGNIVNANTTNGIRLTSNASRSIVTGNSCRDNTGTGILIDASAVSNVVTSNVALGNSTAQLTDNGTTTSVNNNVVA
mgnify:CR=1 FL=1